MLYLPDPGPWPATLPDTPVTPRDTLNASAAGGVVDTQASVAAENAPLRVIYGEVRLGPLICTVLPYLQGNVILAVWGHGEVDEIVSMSIDDEVLTFGTITTLPTLGKDGTYTGGGATPINGNVHNYTGKSAQTADTLLIDAFAGQGHTYADNLPGICYSVIYVPTGTSTGFPRINALIRGRKVWTGAATEWSDNPAWCLADFITNTTYGAARTMDWTSVAAVAADCNALVGGEKRRTLNLALETVQPVKSWLDTLRTYAGCWITQDGPNLKLIADKAGSVVASITHAAGQIQRIANVKKRGVQSVPTVLTLTYTDTTALPHKPGTVTIYAAGVLAGTTPRRESTVSLPGINRYSQANREAIERLNKLALNDLSMSLSVFDEALALEVGDIVTVTHPMGFAAKQLRVQSITGELGRFELGLLEYDPAVYDDTVATAPTWADTDLPDPTLEFAGAVNGIVPREYNRNDLNSDMQLMMGSGDYLFGGAGITANPATGVVKAPTFQGALSGNADSASVAPWSGISSKPTTVAGFGITDGLKKVAQSGRLDDLPMGSFNEYGYGGDTTSNLPVSPSGGAQWWNVITLGAQARSTQLAVQAYGDGAGNAPQNAFYIRSRHDDGAPYDYQAWTQVWTAKSLTNLNQLTNGPGYIGPYGALGNSDGGDTYMNFRVMRNSSSAASNDGMYIGFGNANGGLTRLFGGGSTSNAVTVNNGAVSIPGVLDAGGVINLNSNYPYRVVQPGYCYFPSASQHLAYYKKTGGYAFYWRRSDDGEPGGPNEAGMMALDDAGILSVGGKVTAPAIHATEWLRNANANYGMYNEATATHLYSEANGAFTIAGNGTRNARLVLRDTHAGTVRGYLWTDSDGFGLLGPNGAWSVRIPGNAADGGVLTGPWSAGALGIGTSGSTSKVHLINGTAGSPYNSTTYTAGNAARFESYTNDTTLRTGGFLNPHLTPSVVFKTEVGAAEINSPTGALIELLTTSPRVSSGNEERECLVGLSIRAAANATLTAGQTQRSVWGLNIGVAVGPGAGDDPTGKNPADDHCGIEVDVSNDFANAVADPFAPGHSYGYWAQAHSNTGRRNGSAFFVTGLGSGWRNAYYVKADVSDYLGYFESTAASNGLHVKTQGSGGSYYLLTLQNSAGNVFNVQDNGTITFGGKSIHGGHLVGLADDNHGMIYDSGVDGPQFRAASGFIWKTGTAGATERMRLTTTKLTVGVGEFEHINSTNASGKATFRWVHGGNFRVGLAAESNAAATGDAYMYLWTSEPGATWTGGGIARNMANTTSSFPRMNASLSGQMIHFREDGYLDFTLESSGGVRTYPLTMGVSKKLFSADCVEGGWSGNARWAVMENTNGYAASFHNSYAGAAGGVLFRIDDTAGALASFCYSSTQVGTITTNGTTTSYNTSSDYRLKTDVAPVSGALDRLLALRPVQFVWAASGQADRGFIAHELQAVDPLAVTGAKDAVDADGNPIYQGIDTSHLIADLVAAIQAQQAQINTLTRQLTH